ncbi:hypothetical protein D0C36_10055 [Mucilaginibacter conchicola]|uniref:Lipocalin-like domain-containing protein n=1 Tax=Mucilaginibacter conchicola TaxID=2303333 RepID=A0A372NRA9_9SPHI|nr:hypothetical protein [Mucilaginibacter conchicola]RFZ91788.1 hypothetical protein D0C36_10055 [Mucilaginibacter conchicola]
MKKATLLLLLCWGVLIVSCKKDSQSIGDESLASFKTKIIGTWATKSVTRISLDASDKEVKRETFDYVDVQKYRFDQKTYTAVKGNIPHDIDYTLIESNGKIFLHTDGFSNEEMRMNNGSLYWTTEAGAVNAGEVVKYVSIVQYKKE